MSEQFSLSAEARSDLGKGSSRRLRRIDGRIPGIVYGGEVAPTPISILAKDIAKATENEAFYSHVLTLSIDGKAEKVVLKDLQRHPAKHNITHADFLRIDESHKIQMQVPLHFLNEDKCVGVKMQGGKIAHLLSEVMVNCLPKDLPEFLSLDLEAINAGTTLHLSDIALPSGVELVELTHGADHNLPVVSVNAPRGADTSTEEETE